MRNAKRSYIIIAAVSVVVFNGWFRGPFGILPFGLFVLPPVVAVAWSLKYLRTPLRVVSVLCVPLSLFVSWYLCAPPTTGTLLREILPNDISVQSLDEVRRWNHNWARDPAYHLKFRMSPEAAERVALNARLRPQEPDRAPYLARHLAESYGTFPRAPDWWNPTEIEHLRAWEGSTRRGWVILCFDSATNLVYLSVLTI